MAWNASTQVEMRTSGSATNGGAFGPNVGTPRTTFIDLSQTAGSTTVTSTGGTFVNTMVGCCLWVTSGDNVLLGSYLITAYISATQVTVDRTFSPHTNTASVAGSVSAGKDYSQQNTAQLALSDITGTSGSTTVNSVTGGFTSDMVGNVCYMAGTNCTTGWYQITAVSSSNAMTVDASPFTGVASGVTCNVGGALYALGSTLATFLTKVPAGATVWMKAGTYSISANCAPTSNATNTASNVWEGYNTTRGDAPTGTNRPLIAAGAYTWSPGNYWTHKYLSFTTTQASGFQTGTSVAGSRVIGCKFVNSSTTTNRYALYYATIHIEDCECVSTYGYAATAGQYTSRCWFHDSSYGIYGTTGANVNIHDCLFENCTYGVGHSSAGYLVFNRSTFFGCNIGIYQTSTANQGTISGCLFAYCITGISHNSGTAYKLCWSDSNNFYGCEKNMTGWFAGPQDKAIDPAFASMTTWSDLACTAYSNIVTSVSGGFSTKFRAGDYLVIFTSGSRWFPGLYRISSVDSDTQITLAADPMDSMSFASATGGITRTLKTGVGVSTCKLGSASTCRTLGPKFNLAVA